MIVYEATKNTFVQDVINDTIDSAIDEVFFQKMGYHTSQSERDSWTNSMQYMLKVLLDKRIPENSGVAIEFRIPNTSKRVDFIISGIDSTHSNSAVIIELKQWQKAEIVSGKDAIVETFTGHAMRQVAHPSYQAWSYATTIEDFNTSVQDHTISLHPCAYLHNYVEVTPPTLLSTTYSEYIEKAPVFIKGDVEKLRDFISKHIKYGDNKETLFMIENGKIRPSKSLQDSLLNMLKGNREFVMLDDQKLVYETAINMARKSHDDGKKRVLVVRGGPGTGKSVVAINLLVQLTNESMLCQYVTKNAAPRNVYAAKLSGEMRKTRINNLFKGSGCYCDCSSDEFDVLIVDEAHRLNEKSGMFHNVGENQIKEIINASRFSVFFIDESQRIDINDIGSVDEILKFINHHGAEYEIQQLESQFRCNGSDGYIAWIDDVLQIRNTANSDGFDIDYDIRIFDNPSEMKKAILEKNTINNKSRMLAGYCYNWITKKNPRSDDYDIEFPEFDFKAKWNFSNSSTWAIDPDSVEQIGCIHTSQGLEFDYAGVIIGKDLRYNGTSIITDYTQRAKTDKSLFGIKKMYSENPAAATKLADEIIKNTYRTLLTRGQKGCFIYCEDEKLREYLKNRIK